MVIKIIKTIVFFLKAQEKDRRLFISQLNVFLGY